MRAIVIALLLAGCGVTYESKPVTSAELEQYILAVEELGVDNVTLIEDERERATWRLTCLSIGQRFILEDGSTLAKFCGPVLTAAD